MSCNGLTGFEWRATAPLFQNKPRSVPRIDDRRVLNGIVRVLRSDAPRRHLPARYGPRARCYNRVARWRMAGGWDRRIDAITEAYDDAIQMVVRSSLRARHLGGEGKRGGRDHYARLLWNRCDKRSINDPIDSPSPHSSQSANCPHRGDRKRLNRCSMHWQPR